MRAAKRLGATACAAALMTLGLGAPARWPRPGPGKARPGGSPNPSSFRRTGSRETRSPSMTATATAPSTPAGTYPTGGLGGKLEGSVVDHLASQGSLTLDRPDGLLLAVNAGSNTVSVFGAFGDRLALRQTIPSGGVFPVSIAVHDGLVYVLNAEEGGSARPASGRLAGISCRSPGPSVPWA